MNRHGSHRVVTHLTPTLQRRIALLLMSYRHRAGLMQRDVERRTGIGFRTLSSFESAYRTDTISLAQLIVLLDAYGVEFATFGEDLGDVVQRAERTAPLQRLFT